MNKHNKTIRKHVDQIATVLLSLDVCGASIIQADLNNRVIHIERPNLLTLRKMGIQVSHIHHKKEFSMLNGIAICWNAEPILQEFIGGVQ